MKTSYIKYSLQILFGLICSIGIMIWLVQPILSSAVGFELGDLAAILRSLPIWVLVTAFLFHLGQCWLRAIRYGTILNLKGEDAQGVKLLSLTFARNMFVDLLPSRLGELTYIFFLKRLFGERVGKGIASMGASFAFDLVALLVLVSVVLVGSSFLGESLGALFLIIPIAIFVCVACLGLFYGFPFAMKVTAGLREKLFSVGLFAKFDGILDDTNDSILWIRSEGQLPRVFFLSLGIRFFKYAGTLLLLFVVLSTSFLPLDLGSLGDLLLGIVAGEASASLPIPSFMSFGTYEAGASMTLQNLGFSLQAALIAIFIVHVITQCMDYSLGGISLYLSWAKGWFNSDDHLEQATENSVFLKRILFGFCFLAVAGLFALSVVWMQLKPVVHSVEVTPVEVAPVETMIDEPSAVDIDDSLQGFAVWATNRDGNHDLVKCDLSTLELTPLTRTPEKEWYPSISKDGTKIVFARTENLGLGAMNAVGWSIVLLDLKTMEETLLSDNGFQPSWAGDSESVVFTRGGNQVILKNIISGEERILIESGKGNIPSGFILYTPSFNPLDQSVAVTVRGARRTKFVYRSDGSAIEFPEGCQLSWNHDYSQLTFTNEGEIGGNAFYTVNPSGDSIELLLDVPRDHSHEYFPRYSDDGKWFIYGASTGDHVHGTADYEIFLWQVGQPMDEVMRLSNDPGNDSWPDIFIEN